MASETRAIELFLTNLIAIIIGIMAIVKVSRSKRYQKAVPNLSTNTITRQQKNEN